MRWQLVKAKEGKMYLTPYGLIAIGLLIVIFSKQIEEFPPWKKPYMKNSKLARFWILFTGLGFIVTGLITLPYF